MTLFPLHCCTACVRSPTSPRNYRSTTMMVRVSSWFELVQHSSDLWSKAMLQIIPSLILSLQTEGSVLAAQCFGIKWAHSSNYCCSVLTIGLIEQRYSNFPQCEAQHYWNETLPSNHRLTRLYLHFSAANNRKNETVWHYLKGGDLGLYPKKIGLIRMSPILVKYNKHTASKFLPSNSLISFVKYHYWLSAIVH
jgi:hypothetical protein